MLVTARNSIDAHRAAAQTVGMREAVVCELSLSCFDSFVALSGDRT